jgi:hypothetical protein
MIGLGSDVHSAVPYPHLRVSVVKLLIKTTTETRRALRSFFPTDTYGVKIRCARCAWFTQSEIDVSVAPTIEP